MSRKSIRNRRAKALAELLELGMTDEEIEAALGHSIEQEQVIETELVPEATRTPTQAQLMSTSKEVQRWTGKPNDEPIDVEVIDIEEDPSSDQPMCETTRVSLPARISPEGENPSSPIGNPKQYSEEWWDNAKPDVQQRRCVRVRATGDRCRQPAIHGGTVCRFHGGAAPHVKAAARARLEMATDRMAQELLGIATTGESESVRLNAIRDALDRGGVSKPTQVELGPIQPKPYEEILLEGITTETREQSRARRGYNAYSPNYGTGSPTDEHSAGSDPDAQSSNPPTAGDSHYAGGPTLVGRTDQHSPAEHGERAPRPPRSELVFPDPASGELMTEDEAALYLARLANERAQAMPVRHPESPHKRYTAHRRRSIY